MLTRMENLEQLVLTLQTQVDNAGIVDADSHESAVNNG